MTARILVVDDEPPIVDVLVYNLEQANYEVLVARDGQEALDVARREQPDLIVLDLMLPEVDGLEVCRRLRRERDVPIIMLTHVVQERQMNEAIRKIEALDAIHGDLTRIRLEHLDCN